MARETMNFILDSEDDDCPDPSLHIAAFLGDLQEVRQILNCPEKAHLLRNFKLFLTLSFKI